MIFPPPDFLQPTFVPPQSNPAQPHKGIMLPRLVNNNSQSGKLTWRGTSAEFHRRTAHFSGLQDFLLWFSLNRNGKKSCKAIVCPKSAIIDATMAVPLLPGVSRLPPTVLCRIGLLRRAVLATQSHSIIQENPPMVSRSNHKLRRSGDTPGPGLVKDPDWKPAPLAG